MSILITILAEEPLPVACDIFAPRVTVDFERLTYMVHNNQSSFQKASQSMIKWLERVRPCKKFDQTIF